MSSESFSGPPQEVSSLRQKGEVESLAQGFRELQVTHEDAVFDELEQDLLESGFALALQPEVVKTFNDNSLICRSESFSRVMDLLLTETPLEIQNKGDANMCIIASGIGFRLAMEEGFSGRDVDGLVKTVLTFKSNHLETRNQIPRTNDLWNTKPETAQVSLSGGGEVFLEDVAMVSFRFPIHHFPNRLLSESEKDLLEENKVGFIVRHYIPHKEKTMQ